MGRVALVTGGSRGIGEAISKKLQADGYTVAATYAGNDEAAAAFTARCPQGAVDAMSETGAVEEGALVAFALVAAY
ncbi:MAG: SDR family NAD(P)-dependent oxidoreductase, partial [Pseudomonadota bacterium]